MWNGKLQVTILKSGLFQSDIFTLQSQEKHFLNLFMDILSTALTTKFFIEKQKDYLSLKIKIKNNQQFQKDRHQAQAKASFDLLSSNQKHFLQEEIEMRCFWEWPQRESDVLMCAVVCPLALLSVKVWPQALCVPMPCGTQRKRDKKQNKEEGDKVMIHMHCGSEDEFNLDQRESGHKTVAETSAADSWYLINKRSRGGFLILDFSTQSCIVDNDIICFFSTKSILI